MNSKFHPLLAYGWRAGNLNWPIRIQQAGNILVSWRQVEIRQLLSLEVALNMNEKGFTISKTKLVGKKEKYEPFCVSKLLFWRQKWVTGALHGNSLVVRRVSSGKVIVVLFWKKYAVPRQIKPGILKLTTSRGQRNLCTVFIFVSCEEKGCYRIVKLGHQNFDCRSYCGLSHRMQGLTWKWGIVC